MDEVTEQVPAVEPEPGEVPTGPADLPATSESVEAPEPAEAPEAAEAPEVVEPEPDDAA